MFGILRSHSHKAGLAVAVLSIAAVPHLAMALPASEIQETFFSGPDFQKSVGSYHLGCAGHPQFKGTETDYMHYVSYSCSRSTIPPVNECLVCPDNNAGDDCNVEACPPVFFQAEHGTPRRSTKAAQ